MKKSDMDICLEYWDAIAKKWIVRAMLNRAGTEMVCGSDIRDFVYNPVEPRWAADIINNFRETLDGLFNKHWNYLHQYHQTKHSEYIEIPLFMRNMFPVLRKNGMARKLTPGERHEMIEITKHYEMYAARQINRTGMEQRLNFFARG